MPKSYKKDITLFGHETPAARCQAKSKRSQQQCRKAAMKDKLVFLDIHVDPNEHVYPMQVPRGSMREMWLSKSERT